MMFNDLRSGYWHPKKFTPDLCARMYSELEKSWQTPKVIQLYAQQCFGIHAALPIDNWVKIFFSWPFNFRPSTKKLFYSELFACSDIWGKIERLIWLAAQARKVHSSVAADILWCVRYGSRREGKMRGANPLSCKICASHVRDQCPAYEAIKDQMVGFNLPSNSKSVSFIIRTSKSNNTSPAQTFVSCEGSTTKDEYSTRDRPDRFRLYPALGHKGEAISVQQFLSDY